MFTQEKEEEESNKDLVSPLKKLRLKYYNRTPEQVAKDGGIQKAAIGQAEEGFYPNPLPAYLIALGIKPGSEEEFELTKEYHEYQSKKRILNGPLHEPKLILSPEFYLTEHPLVSWRFQSNLSTYGFCSAYCIHMPSVNNFEKNILNITNLPPNPIKNALEEAGYDLEEFIEACVLYKTNLQNVIRNQNNLPLL